jgi:hypothetical protein
VGDPTLGKEAPAVPLAVAEIQVSEPREVAGGGVQAIQVPAASKVSDTFVIPSGSSSRSRSQRSRDGASSPMNWPTKRETMLVVPLE